MPQPPISFAILSDHRLGAEALTEALARQGFRPLAPASAGDEVPAGADVVLVDAGAGREAVLAKLWRLQAAATGVKLLVFGVEEEGEAVVDFIEAGAGGYALLSSSPADLGAAIRGLMQGEARCSPQVAAAVIERTLCLAREQPPPQREVGEPLTAREREVLSLLARGLRNKEIGGLLGIEVQTVKNHVHSILAKLAVHRRREAVRLGLELGFVEEAGPTH